MILPFHILYIISYIIIAQCLFFQFLYHLILYFTKQFIVYINDNITYLKLRLFLIFLYKLSYNFSKFFSLQHKIFNVFLSIFVIEQAWKSEANVDDIWKSGKLLNPRCEEKGSCREFRILIERAD